MCRITLTGRLAAPFRGPSGNAPHRILAWAARARGRVPPGEILSWHQDNERATPGDPPRPAGLPAGLRASAPRVLRPRARAGRDPQTARAGRARWLLVQRPRPGAPPRRRGG